MAALRDEAAIRLLLLRASHERLARFRELLPRINMDRVAGIQQDKRRVRSFVGHRLQVF